MLTRRQFKQSGTVEMRLAAEAKRLREEALPPGVARDEKLRKTRQAETGSHMSEWLRSPGLRPTVPTPTSRRPVRGRDPKQRDVPGGSGAK